MVTHMKTTIDIADPVLERAKRRAREQNTTLRAVVEEALRAFVDAPPKHAGYVLQDRSVPGGLSPEFANATWHEILDEVYRGETDRAAANL